jgi:hypothetical protein
MIQVSVRDEHGSLVLSGRFQVLHRELTETGEISLISGETDSTRARRLALLIDTAELEEVQAAAMVDAHEQLAQVNDLAEEHVLERLRL